MCVKLKSSSYNYKAKTTFLLTDMELQVIRRPEIILGRDSGSSGSDLTTTYPAKIPGGQIQNIAVPETGKPLLEEMHSAWHCTLNLWPK